MSIFAGASKCNLKILSEELGETVDNSHKLKDLKKMILASKVYNEESTKECLNTIINERKEREENERRNEEIAERRLQEEIQIEKRRRREEKNTRNGSERKNTRNGSERMNLRNGRERMKWNLSCKKCILEQKVGFQIPSPIKM
ncbi:hypothetical protein AVEN_218580-1 [Araneus ventricosus]|uniref:Uncharacterized protein n=1 Tax=Araneus ventricosus TaxID=182803 RepID=A0A4Y2Q100_ARAVE|nr:hypothetical protein AVEN_191833-1 [Araneus ventricosus]GBN57828.1 hypothetical protein AVEN_218580-1 [Araneus ventricosus]